MLVGTITLGKILLRSLRSTVSAALSAISGFILRKLPSNSSIAVVLFAPIARGAKFGIQLEKFVYIWLKSALSSGLVKPPVYLVVLRYLHAKYRYVIVYESLNDNL